MFPIIKQNPFKITYKDMQGLSIEIKSRKDMLKFMSLCTGSQELSNLLEQFPKDLK